MNKILSGKELDEFIKDNKLECHSIIIRVDNDTKEASYVIDGETIVPVDYEMIVKYL